MNLTELPYPLYKDIMLYLEAAHVSLEAFSNKIGLSKTTLQNIKNGQETSKDVLEKVYSYIYVNKYRLNKVKSEYLKEEKETILFHVPKVGGERGFNRNFGNGVYLCEEYNNALSYTSSYNDCSINAYRLNNIQDLNTVRFNIDLEWMLAICYCRGTIKQYENHPILMSIKNKINTADIIIAPIADNKMFSIISSFAQMDINEDVALHSLSASSLGLQYVIKTQKAMERLECIEKYYICNNEKEEAKKETDKRSLEIETKLKLAKMKYKNGLFIEEIFN